MSAGGKKVAICVPSLHGPTKPFVDAVEASLAPVLAAGWESVAVEERGNPYISKARAEMLRKALDAGADVIVFIDYDVSWGHGDLLKLIETEGDVVAGLYRFKKDEEHYMGTLDCDPAGFPTVRASDGALRGILVPAGFLKVTPTAIDRLMGAHPDLCFGPRYRPLFDLFNHGAHEGLWWGEDYAFCRRWRALGGDIWIVPDLDLTHHAPGKAYPGNYHEFLLRQPGGINDPMRPQLKDIAA